MTTKTTTESAETAESPRPRRRRLWRLIQLLNLVLLPLLVILYGIYAVEHQQEPVHGWVAGTPLESAARAMAPYLLMQRERLGDQLQNAPLTAREEEAVVPLLERMEATRPTHLIVGTDGSRRFGRLVREDGGYVLTVYAGGTFTRLPLAKEEIASQQPLALPAAELAPRDLRFLLEHQAAGDAWFLPPWLIVSDGDFPEVFTAYSELLQLRTELAADFAPLVRAASAGRHLHICILYDRHTYVNMARHGTDLGLVNSVGHFRRAGQRLYLLQEAAGDQPRVGGSTSGNVQVLRHEAAHLLAHHLGILPSESAAPFWLEEGLAQYYEDQPPGRLDAHKLAILREARAAGTLMPWAEIRALSTEALAELPHTRVTLAYAQAWWLVRRLMDDDMHTHFLAWLNQRQAPSPEAPQDPELNLMNNLRTSASKLAEELDDALTKATTTF